MQIKIPELSLVILVGPSGAGKTTFARQHFLPTEVFSSDAFRAWISDDENNQTASALAFDALHYIAAKRLEFGKLTVIDATNLQKTAREPLLEIAKKYHCQTVAIVFNLPEDVCHEHNRNRPDRTLPEGVIRNHCRQMRGIVKELKKEGIRYIYQIRTLEELNAVEIERTRLWTDKREEKGPFDIIGDVHGCYEELVELLGKLGYQFTAERVFHPDGRKAIFLGDLVDRGPNSPGVLRLVMKMVATGDALCVPGNHDIKLLRKLNGKNVKVAHGLEQTLEQLANEPQEWIEEVKQFLDSLISHYVLDGGRLVVAHAGMKESMQGRASGAVRSFALYGETTGETDEFGLPVRLNWAEEYRGKAMVVYGHTPVSDPIWLNRTINIDTGCVFGGKLTAMRYPEKELVSVDAKRIYAEPIRPIQKVEEEHRTYVLQLDDVRKQRLRTRYLSATLKISPEQMAAALETMSRFAVDPRWLIYLPPTMSPPATSKQKDLLEHPQEAFQYYFERGISKLICEEKHMGSRAIVIVCRERAVSQKRFGMNEPSWGIIYTRTGRRFFNDPSVEQELLQRLSQAMDRSGFWDEFSSDWACLDCELMPWSAKAEELLRQQYAAVASAARQSLLQVIGWLEQAQTDGRPVEALLARYREKLDTTKRFTKVYRNYCWQVAIINDFKLAPFHLLATEGKVHSDQDHVWHMQTIAKICDQDPDLLLATKYKVVDQHDTASIEEAIRWWEDLTDQGGEGIVVKPFSFLVKGEKGLIQPAIKCRGKEYLRIIYGPEYTMEENLVRLRDRGLNRKRTLAIQEFALGLEGLERFVACEPLWRVHECCFGILALESEPIDPRL